MKGVKVTPVINKRNGQINISLPKKKINKKLLKEILEREKKELKVWFDF